DGGDRGGTVTAGTAARPGGPARATGRTAVGESGLAVVGASRDDGLVVTGNRASSRPLVGRAAELRQLAGLLGLDPVGEPLHVLLGGDAGVGKTRLLTELRDRAVARGWQVQAGHCIDLGDSAMPYMPFSEVLDRLTADAPAVVERIAADFPALSRLRPVRRSADRPVDLGEETGSVDRTHLFGAVHALLEAVAADGPLLLVVEDAHWADRSTRDLLTYLFTRPFDAPVALVVSYRADDLHRRHPLRRQVAEWARLPSVGRLMLGPLDDDAVRSLVHELSVAVPAADVDAIVERAEGNAFFVEELVGAGDDLPEDLADLLLVRLDRLGEDARQVVRTASAAGRRVSHDLLDAVAELPAAALEAALRASVEQNVLVPTSRRYYFRHALLAEAVYDDLLPGERVRLHAGYAAALRADPSLGTAAELARHSRLAHDLPGALLASIQAGEEALAVGGPDEAAQHLTTALSLAEDAGTLGAVEVDVDRIAERAADALLHAGQAARADAVLTERLARIPSGPSVGRARLLATKAEVTLSMESGEEPLELSARAVEALPEDAPPLTRAVVLAIRARILTGFDRTAEAEAVGLDALDLAERHGHPKTASEIMLTLSQLRWTGPVDALRSSLRAAVQRARETGARHSEMRGLYYLGRSYSDWGDYAEAAEHFAASVRVAAEAGTPWAPYGFDSRWQLMWIRMIEGDWEAALTLGDADRAPRLIRGVLDSVRLCIEVARGADRGRELAALRRYWPQEGAIAINSAGAEIVLAGRNGDAAAAIGAYDDAVAALSMIWHAWFGARVRLAALTLGALATAWPAVPAAERPALVERAAGLSADAEATLIRYADPATQWGPEGRAWAQRSVAESLRVRWLAAQDPPRADQLVTAWRECERAFVEFGDVYELAVVRTELFAVLRSTGDLAGARERGDLARATARRLGAQPLLDRLRVAGGAAVRGGASATTLTPREHEILELVAEGRSNGEIASRLFISTKTVSVHVSNILGKLGAAGRTEAAAIARRTGLLD
ncbi:MAG: AAA family ATPase, partial [Nocardioides sp.]|uniref:helix-turn-helix transcriptional regulator n=1 Tax=Nocardioides sp. TaxID=35761 RepID=UPI0039E704AF